MSTTGNCGRNAVPTHRPCTFPLITRSHTGNQKNAMLEATVSQNAGHPQGQCGKTTYSPGSRGCTIGYHGTAHIPATPKMSVLAFS
jgi:hypothetical protein